MTDWIAQHKGSVQFVIWSATGLILLFLGIFGSDPALVALGAGSIGLPGFAVLTEGTDR